LWTVWVVVENGYASWCCWFATNYVNSFPVVSRRLLSVFTKTARPTKVDVKVSYSKCLYIAPIRFYNSHIMTLHKKNKSNNHELFELEF